MGDRLVSLAAGTILDVGPAEAVTVASTAGWPAVGLWFDPATWTDATTRDVHQRLRDTGLVALDVEPIILGRGGDRGGGDRGGGDRGGGDRGGGDRGDGGERLLDAAAELGVPFVLMASGGADDDRVMARLTQLCEYASVNAPGVRIALEFLPIFSVASLTQALAIVRSTNRSEAAVLVDTLHLARSGGVPDDLIGLDAALLPYLQLADASAVVPADIAALRDEALDGRVLPGEGVLPLRQVLANVPGVPISVELRSRSLRDRYTDPVERARVVLDATRRVIAAVE